MYPSGEGTIHLFFIVCSDQAKKRLQIIIALTGFLQIMVYNFQLRESAPGASFAHPHGDRTRPERAKVASSRVCRFRFRVRRNRRRNRFDPLDIPSIGTRLSLNEFVAFNVNNQDAAAPNEAEQVMEE